MGSTLGCSGDTGTTIAVQPASASPRTPAPAKAKGPKGNPRNKTALKPGRSLMDWVKLGHSGVDLTGTKGGSLLDVTPQELAKHSKRKDAWMALKGKVYNVTPYLEFHPGGEEELMRGAGKDATDLFNEVHKWVNFEGMLQKCLVGRLVEGRPFFLKPSFLPLGRNSNKTANATEQKNSLSVPNTGVPTVPSVKSSQASPLTPSPLPNPKYDWFQTNTVINLAVYTHWKHITRQRVVVLKEEAVVRVVCYIQDMVYVVHLELDKPVAQEFEVRISGSAGKVDVLLQKSESGVRWSRVGKTLAGHGVHLKAKDREIEYVECSLVRREAVTHNTCLLVLQAPDHAHLPVPVGYHVYLRSPSQDVVKPYTPVASSLALAAQEQPGTHIHLFIKVYSEGALTPILDALPTSATLEVSLPEGTFSQAQLTRATTTASHLVLLAAGTGITPMVKLMNVHLILFNKTESDIPWKQEFESLMEESDGLLKATHVLSEGSTSWTGLRGRIDKTLLQKLLPERNAERTTYLCFLLGDLGYHRDDYHAFLG
ncbi:Cytochrome b5 reductase 4 [Chionoecetes opilio]|uniref:Cytochrome b5 reductase 4 n=1 Tax=Chionoecetes opilio TaxID=41210 RepID=A0A8J4Y8W0_CHIOP|nr:Cytochrome b5 reductase 4 [Chionoecetes opilio]